jgi:hypothetical protein
MSWQSITLNRSLGVYRAAWDELNLRYYGGHPFLDSRFTETLLRHFGTNSEQLFIHRTRNAIDGLVILRARGRGVWQQFVPHQLQTSPLLIPDFKLIDSLFGALPLNAWSIELMNQDPEYFPPGLTEDASRCCVLPHALTMNISLKGDFDTYWDGRSRKLVHNIRRYARRIVEAYGTESLEVITEPGYMPIALARYGELESKGWKSTLGTAVHADNIQGRFYLDLMSRFAETGQAEVFEYKIGERLVASRLVINGGGLSVMLKTTYDEDFSSFAPGRLLLYELLKYEFGRQRHKLVEFYTNATRDQLAWATGQRVINHVTCFRWLWLASLYRIYQRLKTSAERNAADEDKEDATPVEGFDPFIELPKTKGAIRNGGSG